MHQSSISFTGCWHSRQWHLEVKSLAQGHLRHVDGTSRFVSWATDDSQRIVPFPWVSVWLKAVSSIMLTNTKVCGNIGGENIQVMRMNNIHMQHCVTAQFFMWIPCIANPVYLRNSCWQTEGHVQVSALHICKKCLYRNRTPRLAVMIKIKQTNIYRIHFTNNAIGTYTCICGHMVEHTQRHKGTKVTHTITNCGLHAWFPKAFTLLHP